MAAVRKKHTEQRVEESKPESVVVSDVVTETTERIEVIEEVTPEETKPDPSASSGQDPLTDFKEKMNEEEDQPVSSAPAQKNFMWPILFVVFLALAFLIGIFLYKQGMNKGTQVNVVTLTPTPTAIPQPTKAVDLTQYEIQVLNGSEVDGEAGRQRDSLEGEGFIVSSVGNADNSDYTETIIQAKADVDSAFLSKLKSVLGDTFTVGETETLPDDASSPVVVIAGTKK